MRPANRREFLSILSRGLMVAGIGPGASSAMKKNRSVATTGYVYDERYLQHVLFANHPESPARLKAIEKILTATGLKDDLQPISLHETPRAHIRLVHSKEHITDIEKIPTTGTIATLAVAGGLAAIDAVAKGTVRNAFCALRPPGHHALNTGREEGFCFYNNIAIAARYAQRVHGFGRVLIIDWDYHHGNGTEWAFYSDPTVLFFSTHELWAYPGTGQASKKGEGDGRGFNINVPLNAGARDQDIYEAWDEHLFPALEKFKPDIVLVSAGFDSRKDDILGRFRLTDACFARMTEMAMGIADENCNGRLVAFLEGGYNIEGQAQGVAAHVTALLGKS